MGLRHSILGLALSKQVWFDSPYYVNQSINLIILSFLTCVLASWLSLGVKRFSLEDPEANGDEPASTFPQQHLNEPYN